MTYENILIFALTLMTLGFSAQNKDKTEEINVLFIGNSLTYFHDMPQTVQKMLNETNPNIKIDQSTFPGQSLSGHLSDIITSRTENGINTRPKEQCEITETEKKIASKKWDVVILQTGTVSVLIPENRELKVNTAIAAIKKLVDTPKCKFIIFSTWPGKNQYPQQYCYPSSMIDKSIHKDKCCSPVLENLTHETRVINESYEQVAKENDLIQSDNGNKFFEMLTQHPEIELYEDESHPNQNGSFLNACIFYRMLTRKKASDLKYTGKIDPATAELLKKISD
jgi:riboflavin synthase